METHIVKIISVEPVTHNVRRFKIEKPEGYKFESGQATEVSLNTPELKDEARPFTFTALNEWPNLEFTIKIYDDHNGVTHALGEAKPGDEIIIRDVWGAIEYKGEGVFIAGGAGVTPFIAIIRQLYKDNKINGNKLIFSNKTSKDIILKDEFTKMLGDNFINILTAEKSSDFENGHVDESFLKEKIDDFSQHFYICGPPPMVKAVTETLTVLGADPEAVVFEK